MALERSDGGPKWTEGVAEVVRLDMKSFDEGNGANPEFAEEVVSLNRKLDECQNEIHKVASNQQKPYDSLIQASKLTRRTQARILKVLSDRVWEDEENMMLIDIAEIAGETDLEYSAVSHQARLLDLQGFVDRREFHDKVKLSYRNAFTEFCDTRLIDPDSI